MDSKILGVDMIYYLKKIDYNNIETIIYYNNIKEARKGFMNEVILDDPDIKDLYLFRKSKMNNKEELIKYGYKSNENI